jgi:hypothetical protein
VVFGVMLAGFGGCSPAMNWRQIRGEGSALQVLMPCKPDRVSRRIRLPDQDLTWNLLSCEAGGATWSMAYGDLSDSTQLAPVLATLQDVAQRNWAVQTTVPIAGAGGAWPPGATPHPNARRWTGEGRRPDGAPLPVQAAWFVQERAVYQLAVLGKISPPDAETWWSSVTFDK